MEETHKALQVNALCTVLARSKSAPRQLREIAERYSADGIDPLACKCMACGCEWDDVLLRDYRTMSCSNCYGDRVIITAIRLSFNDWGEQNGGREEQSSRWQRAKEESTPADELLERIKVDNNR